MRRRWGEGPSASFDEQGAAGTRTHPPISPTGGNLSPSMAIIRRETAMPKTSASRNQLKELGRAVWVVVKSLKELEASYQVPIANNNNENTDHDDGEASEDDDAMNVEKHLQTVAPMQVGFDGDMISRMIPSLLQRGKHGLSSLSQHTLRQNLEPIMNALSRLDAELLLDLEATEEGPQVQEGRFVKPIYTEVVPPIYGADTQSCVRYLHISEIPDQYSIGIFVFAPHARIPLHDHPGMCVLSRVLYGDLQRLSLDLARDDEDGDNGGTTNGTHHDPAMMSMDDSMSSSASELRRSAAEWFTSFFNKCDPCSDNKLPEGTKRAYKNHVDHLKAPAVTVLYPFEGNLHEFVAGPHGAAVLDVLLPPYDHNQNRDCTFYTIHDIPPEYAEKDKEPCYIVPTGQPENFHCISGVYHDLGAMDDLEY